MKLDRKYRIEAAISRDATRPHLASAWLDVEAQRLVATTGHLLAVVPVELDKRDTSGAVSAAAVTATRTSKLGSVARRGLVVLGNVTFRRARDIKHPAGSASQRADVVPTFKPGDKGTVTFGLDPTRLMRLAQALGAGRENTYLALTVKLPAKDRPMLDGILVTKVGDEDALGVLMPARVGK